MRRARLLCALLVVAAPATVHAQLGAVSGADALSLRPTGGARVLSSAAFASQQGSGAALAALATNVAWPIGGAILGIDAALGWTNRGALAGTGGANVLVSGGATRFRLRLGAGVAPDAHAGPSVVVAGAVIERGGFSLSLGSNLLPSLRGLYRDTIVTLGDTTQRERIMERAPRPSLVYADAEIGYRRSLSRFEIAGVVGHRVAGDSLTRPWWARVTSSMRVTATTVVGFTLGRDGGTPWLDAAGRTFTTVFVRHDLPTRATRPSRPPEAVGPLRMVVGEDGAGRETDFAIDAPGARTVELAGDFTDWAPIRMRRDGGGGWRLALPVPPGVHHVSLRIDGGPWRPPPGLPIVPDEFGGESGVFIVR
jgi:hypothetical protein